MNDPQKKRNLLDPFENILKDLPDKIGPHLANLEITDQYRDIRAAKREWRNIKKRMDDLINEKIGKEVKAEILAITKQTDDEPEDLEENNTETDQGAVE